MFPTLLTLMPPAAHASADIEVQSADLQDRFGNLMPTNGVAALVADTGTNGFVDPQPTFPLGLGATWGNDDKVVGLWDLRNCGCGDGILDDFATVTYSGGIASGQKLQLYWFPSLTLASNIVGAAYYGKYSDTNSPPLDGSDVWQVPADGTSVSLSFLTQSEGGSNPDTAGRASQISGYRFFGDLISSLSSGNLVGQNGWLQLGTSTANPLQVTNGALVYPSGLTTTNQTAYKNFPVTTNAAVFVGFRMAIDSAVTNGGSYINAGPPYIATIYNGNDGTTTSGTFAYYRFTARCPDTGASGLNGGGTNFFLGTRVGGQAGAPWVFTTQSWPTGTVLNVILMTDPNGSNSTMWVSPTSPIFGVDASAVVAAGGTNGLAFTADQAVGSVGFSQFGTAASPSDGARFFKIAVSTNWVDMYNFLSATNSVVVVTTNSWSSAADGKWETGANWSSSNAPALSDTADFITNANTKTVTIDATTAGFPSTMTISNLTMSAPSGSGSALSLNGAGTVTPLHILNSFTIGTNGSVQVINSALRVDSVSGGTFTIYGGSLTAYAFTNSGTLTVTGGGTLDLEGNWSNGGVISNDAGFITLGGTFTTAGLGVLKNPGGTNTLSGTLVNSNATLALGPTTGSWYLQGGTIQGGTVTTSGGAQLQMQPFNAGLNSGTLDGVTLNSPLTLTNGNQLFVTSNGLTLSSTITLTPDCGHNAIISFLGAQTLAGNGQILLAGPCPGQDILGENGGTLTIGSSITIHGGGFINGDCNNPLLNQGTITADASNQTLNVSCFVNQGQLLATNGGNLSLNSFTNNGVISVSGGTLSLNGTYTTAAMGTISNAANSKTILNGTLTGCGTVAGNIVVQGNVQANCGTTFNFSGGTVTNNGTVTASSGTVLNFYVPVVNNGLIDATGGAVHFFSTLSGSGSVLTPPTNSWIAGDGKWETATNWSSGLAPSLADSADLITNAGNNTVTIDATTSGSFPNSLTIFSLIVGAPLNMTNTLLLSNTGTNAPLAVSKSVRVDSGGSMFITNSALQVNGPLGGALTVDGQLTMNSGTMLVSSNLLVGPLNSSSLVTIRGGALYVTNAAHNAVSEVRYGTLVLTSGVYFTDSLLITNTGASFVNDGGFFTITGLAQVDQGTQTVASGTTQLSSNLVVGSSVNATGTVNVTGGQLIVTNAPITIADFGVGNMSVSNATVSTTGVDIGAGTNSQGTLTLQDGSTMTISSNLTAGSAFGAAGTVNVTGGQLVATNGVIGIGNGGTTTNGAGVGQMTVSNGTVLASTILLGSSAGGKGDLTLADGGLITCAGTNCVLVANDFTQVGGDLDWTNIGSAYYCGYTHPGVHTMSNGTASCQDLYIGYDDVGTATIAGGTMNILSRLIVGQLGSPVSTGTVWITGGQVTIANYSIIGNSGIGQMTISNGTVTAVGVFVGNTSNPGTLTLAGGTLTLNSLVLTNPSSRFIFSGGWLNANAIIQSNGRAFIAGDGVNLAALNLLGGTTATGKGFSISTNAMLLGLGTISGNVVNFGVISPGGGALSFSGIVTNFGVIAATHGNTINFNAQVINKGLIFTNSAIHFSAGMTNNGTLVDAAGDPDHDGFTNLEEYEAGTDPNDPNSTPLQIASIVQQGNDVLLTWTTAGGKTNVVQAAGASGDYSNKFTDLSPIIVPNGSDLTSTNYLDVGAATNFPARYYRVRLVP